MMSSPCAMLMTPMTPNVIDRPIAARTSIEPRLKPNRIVSTVWNLATVRSIAASASFAASRMASLWTGPASGLSLASAVSFMRTVPSRLPCEAAIAASRVASSGESRSKTVNAVRMASRTSASVSTSKRSRSSGPKLESAAAATACTAAMRLSGSASRRRKPATRPLKYRLSALLTVTRRAPRRPTSPRFSSVTASRSV